MDNVAHDNVAHGLYTFFLTFYQLSGLYSSIFAMQNDELTISPITQLFS